tara:strand:+ start:3890 stop:4726 length:837 start_codon:yes stop_codon:yes gene_type:complete
MSNRLFTFGCSYTSWNWPTWADFYANEFRYYENWGMPGIGNRGIADRVVECDLKNNFNAMDTVVVQWSSYLRHDYRRFEKGLLESWQTKGSIFNYKNENIFNKEWQEKFFDEKAYFLNTLNAILLTEGYLKSKGCKFYFTSIGKLETLGTDIPHQAGHGENLRNTPELSNAWEEYDLQDYKYIFDKEHWLEPIGLYAWNRPDQQWWFEGDNGEKWIELHPSPEQHLNYCVDNLSHKLNDKSENALNTVNSVKKENYKDTIKNITNLKIEGWDREVRGL